MQHSRVTYGQELDCTQIIDRCWRHVRAHVGNRGSSSGGTKLLNTRMRSAQWTYWNKGRDLFKETVVMLRDL